MPDGKTLPQMIVVDAGQLLALIDEVAALRRAVEQVQIQPRPDWMTVRQYAVSIGRHIRTVNRRIAEGQLECKAIGGERMVRVSPAA